MQITQKQLVNRLSKNRRANIVTIFAQTVPKLLPGCPYRGQVIKLAEVNGMINWIYKNAVNAQREREGQPLEPVEMDGVIYHPGGGVTTYQVAKFQPLPRYWGERVKGTPFVVYEDQHYLEMKIQRRRGEIYLVNGQPASDFQMSRLSQYLAPENHGRRQRVDRPVVLRDYRLDHIVKIRFDGQELDLNKPIWTVTP